MESKPKWNAVLFVFVVWTVCYLVFVCSSLSPSFPLSMCIVFAVLCLKSDAFDKRHVPHAKKYATQFLVRLAKPGDSDDYFIILYVVNAWELNLSIVYNAFVCHLHTQTRTHTRTHTRRGRQQKQNGGWYIPAMEKREKCWNISIEILCFLASNCIRI